MKTLFELYKRSIMVNYRNMLFNNNITYGMFSELVDKYKYILKEHNIKKNDNIVIISNNSPDWAAINFASLSFGSLTIPIYRNQHQNVKEYIINETQPKIILSDTDYHKSINFKKINFNNIKEYVNDDYVPHENDNCTILYSSGTTGKPKGIVLTHQNLCSNLISLNKANSINFINSNDKIVSFLPWSHIYGMNCELHYAMMNGVSIYINEDINKLSNDFNRENPTFICAVPRLLQSINEKINNNIITKAMLNSYIQSYTKNIIKNKIFGNKLRFITIGGASISTDLLKFYENIGVTIYQGYGLSETSPMISVNTHLSNKLGSVGKILNCNDVIINDKNEIMVKGSNVFKSYYKNEEETEKLFTNGYFNTGDVGYIDDNNYLYITGRTKEIYKLDNGKYISPSSIENSILTLQKVKQVFVYGDNKPYNIALVVSNYNTEDILKDMQTLNNVLKKYEIPKKIIKVEPFTFENNLLTPKMSIIRKNVYEKYKNDIDLLYI